MLPVFRMTSYFYILDIIQTVIILSESGCGSVREREKKLFTTKQIINITNKMNLCGRLPGRKFPSSWPPMLIQIKQSNQINLTFRS